MELIRIDEEKLKIILSHEDLSEFDIDESELDYASADTRRMFREILRRARRVSGFDTEGHRVLVQLYPSPGGGCEIFVTRLGFLCCECDPELDDHDDHDDYDENWGNDAMNLTKHSQTMALTERQSAFGFDSLESLLCVCRRLCARGAAEPSDAYRSELGRYYLFLADTLPSLPFSVDESSFLYEYGTSEPTDTLLTQLAEHGTPICLGDAIARLGAL